MAKTVLLTYLNKQTQVSIYEEKMQKMKKNTETSFACLLDKHGDEA